MLNRSELLAAADPDDRPRRARALDLVEQTLAALDPGAATAAVLDRWAAADPTLAERPWTVFALGKAAARMAAGVSWPVAGGLLLGPGAGPPLIALPVHHPLPHPRAPESGRRLLAAAQALGPADRVLVLVSGGGSSMATAPRLPLAEWSDLQDRLMAAGADIAELNAVRQRFDAIKGGGLARAIAPAALRTVVLSDVPGLPPEWVASGPTTSPRGGPDPAAVLARFGLARPLPPPADPPPPSPMAVAADNDAGVQHLRRALAEFGLPARPGASLGGDAYAAGVAFARSGAAVAGGETTVVVQSTEGFGGRNSEFLLGAAEVPGDGLICALATDGRDGHSELAGGLLDASARRRITPAAVADARARSDSATLLQGAGAAIITGATGGNVADLVFRLP